MNPLTRRSVLIAPALAVAAGQLTAAPAQASPRRSALRVRGGDLSFTPQLEAAGVTFRDRGVVRPVERILARHGATYVRLRVWTDPPGGTATRRPRSPWPAGRSGRG
jgi:arabinogalactan endo-1,4-beta-galactosidase